MVEQRGLQALYRAYRADMVRNQMPHYVRTGALIVLLINIPFTWLDQFVFGEQLAGFIGVRLALSVAAGMALWLAPRWPRASEWGIALATEAMLVAAVYWTGDAPRTDYYAGLVLFCCGLSVLVPFRASEAALVCGLGAVAFSLSPWLTEGFDDWRLFLTHAFFIYAAGLVSVGSCHRLEQNRFRDYRLRREVEAARDQLKELDRVKSRFTANIHHELRTPLTLMLAPLEAIRSGDFGEVPASIDRTLRTMQANGLRLLKLINNLLDLAKVESQQLTVRRVPLELPRLVGEVVDGARGLAERKGLALEARVDPAVGVVNADPDALEKVVVNLLGNALKFTEEGSVTVELGPAAAGELPAAEGGGPAPGVHLVVRDTGMGIPADQLGKVFDRFAQVDGSATRRHEGTGIGLSLVKELVELHGGRCWAESGGAGAGAAMHVVLPVGEADGEADEEVLLGADGQRGFTAAASFTGLAAEVGVDLDEARMADLARTVERHEGGRAEAVDLDVADLPAHPPGTPEVVIAEDNPEMRRLLAVLIGREFRVRPARHGAEALAFVRERPPELVVTDVMMPEMSGTELCEAIKRDPATRGVPVMLVTSKAEREMKIEGLELGAEDYVTKPFHPRELLARVRSLVRLRSLQEELAASNETLARSNEELAGALAELKAAEVQLVQAERLAAVGELSAGVAHEVNNPLNFARNALATLRGTVEDVQGFAGRLAGLDPRDPGQLEAVAREKQALGLDDAARDLAELVGIVTEGLDRTAKLVAELRDFAAPTRRSRGPVDVTAGLRSTLRLLGHRLRDAGAQLETDLPAGLPPVAGDAGALNQVFLNLLKNAAEALEGQCGGPLHVSARAEGRELVVAVRDGGPGMDEATRARLFEPFFTTKEAGRGTGLGLSICQRIVGEHGGRIAVASAPGEGTTFEVRLPAAQAPGAEEAPRGA